MNPKSPTPGCAIRRSEASDAASATTAPMTAWRAGACLATEYTAISNKRSQGCLAGHQAKQNRHGPGAGPDRDHDQRVRPPPVQRDRHCRRETAVTGPYPATVTSATAATVSSAASAASMACQRICRAATVGSCLPGHCGLLDNNDPAAQTGSVPLMTAVRRAADAGSLFRRIRPAMNHPAGGPACGCGLTPGRALIPSVGSTAPHPRAPQEQAGQP